MEKGQREREFSFIRDRICSNLKVGASLTYFYNLSRQVRHSSYDMHESYNAGILRGGIHLAVTW